MAARQSKAQKETVARVMHEFKHGELRINGNGPKVKSPKQAIAVALHEAGASNEESASDNRKTLRKTKAKERQGDTAEAAREGKRAQQQTMKGASAAKSAQGGKTRDALYAEAKRRGIEGRSRMNKAELERALAS